MERKGDRKGERKKKRKGGENEYRKGSENWIEREREREVKGGLKGGDIQYRNKKGTKNGERKWEDKLNRNGARNQRRKGN